MRLLDNNELMHYGVLGMKWGVRRASKQLGKGYATGDTAKVQKATAKLEKHRGKAQKKIDKLSKTNEQLEKKRDRQIIKNEPRIANSIFTSERKHNELMNKANKYKIEANRLKAISEYTKAEIAKNDRLSSQYSKGIKDIDQAIATKGRGYIKKIDKTGLILVDYSKEFSQRQLSSEKRSPVVTDVTSRTREKINNKR